MCLGIYIGKDKNIKFRFSEKASKFFVGFSEKLNFTNKSELEAGSSVKKHSDIEFS